MTCVLPPRTLLLRALFALFLTFSAAAGPNGRVTQSEVATLKSSLPTSLSRLESQFVGEVLAEQYPLIGRSFAVSWTNNVGAFRFLSALNNAITLALNNLPAQADYAPADIATAINTRLTSAGFNPGSQVIVTTPNGNVALAFTTLDLFTQLSLRFAPDINYPNARLTFETPPNARGEVTVNFNFTVGVDALGFVWNTAATTFTFNPTVTLGSGFTSSAQFLAIGYDVTDPPADRMSIPLNIMVSVRDPNGDGALRLEETAGDFVDGYVTGQSRVALRLLANLPSSAMVPTFGTDLKIRQTFSGAKTDPFDDNSSFGGPAQVTFENLRVNLGEFFDNFATRAFNEINRYTEPLQPVIDALTAEIPVLSDLGSDGVTILDVLGVDPGVVAAIGGLARLSDLASLAAGFSGNETAFVDLGNYTLTGDLRTQPIEDFPGGVTRAPNAAVDADFDAFMDDANFIRGLDLPIVKDGNTVARLLLGRPATLFTWESGEIAFTEDYRQFFPVFGPVGVTLRGAVSLTTEFAFGYDTQGLIEYFNDPNRDENLFFNGFYAVAADENLNPVTGIAIDATIAAGIAANFGLASFGVEGDITATVGFYMDYLLADDQGRLRGNFLANSDVDDLFYAFGAFSSGLRAYVEVGFPPFSVSYDIESPRFTIVSYDSRDIDTPILAELVDTTLVLNVGDRAPRRRHGDIDDRAEEYKIAIDGATLLVSAFNAENTFATAPTSIVGQANLRGDILELDPAVNIPANFTGGDSIDILIGGAANDILEGNEGPDKLRGQGGNDTLRGGADNDELNGGDGDDILNGGEGMDMATWSGSLFPVIIDLRTGFFGGAAAGDTLISIERYAGTGNDDTLDGSEGDDTLLRGLAGNDTIRGHAGIDVLEGGSGDDLLEGGPGQDMLNGGLGADRLDGGDDQDTLSYLGAFEPVTVSLLTGLGTRGEANGDVVQNFEILMGSGLPKDQSLGPNLSGDILEGSDHIDLIFGMEGADTIRGMGGNDILHGNHPDAGPSLDPGFDDDTIRGGAGDDQIFGQEGNDDLDGEEGRDMIDAGLGDDHLKTFDLLGIDSLEGGVGYNRLSADYSDKTVSLNFAVGQPQNFEFPDGDKFMNISTLGTLTLGPADDVIRLFRGLEPQLYPKSIDAGPGNDLIIADSRHTYPGGSRSNDSLHGGDGNDTVSFEQSIGGVNVNLSTMTTGNYATGVTISGFENVVGSIYGDVLTGDAGDNIIMPLLGGPESAGRVLDRIDGGGGTDILRVDYSSDPVINELGISMTPNATTGGEAIMVGPAWDTLGRYAVLTYNNIERFEITGGAASDRLYGEGVNFAASNYDDRLIGMGGNDVLDTRFGNDYLDGGEGNDTLLAGTGSDTAIGGPGNDNITFVMHAGYGDDFVDAGPGNDRVIDSQNQPSGDSTSGNASTRFRFDGGDGFDSIEIDLGFMTTPIVIDTTQPMDLPLPNNGYLRNFENILGVTTGSADDRVHLPGRFNNEVGLRGGNDILYPGLGIDTVNGGPGDDLLIVDYSDDDPELTGVTFNNTGSKLERRSLSSGALVDSLFPGAFERIHVTGTSKADVIRGQSGPDIILGRAGDDNLSGNSGNDFIHGGPGADSLFGNDGNDTLDGADGGNDILNGANNADTFVLGTESVRYYSTSGNADYATIQDFRPSLGDRLRLKGSGSEYLLGASPIEGLTGAALYHDVNGNSVLEPATDELIAILQSAETLTAANTLNNARTINNVEPAEIGLTPLIPILARDVNGLEFTIEFTHNNPLPADVTLEIQATPELGANVPWTTVATKMGVNPWTATIPISTSGDATVTVTLSPDVTATQMFYRARITRP